MAKRSSRHHAQSQHADTANADKVHTQIQETWNPIRKTDRNQAQASKQIAGKQNPKHRLFQHGFIPPAVHLHGKNHTGSQRKQRGQSRQNVMRHQHGGQHRQPK